MKFFIKNNKCREREHAPCPNASKMVVTWIDRRYVSMKDAKEHESISWFDEWYNGKEYQVRKNHRENTIKRVNDEKEKVIECDVEEKVWIIEINTLEDIMGVFKYGPIAIYECERFNELRYGIVLHHDGLPSSIGHSINRILKWI